MEQHKGNKSEALSEYLSLLWLFDGGYCGMVVFYVVDGGLMEMMDCYIP